MNNTVVRYRIRSKNGVGYGPYSPCTSITTDRTPLQPLAPTNGEVTYNSIQLAWVIFTTDTDMGRDPVINYKLQYDSNNGTGYNDLVTLSSTATSYTHTLTTPFPANADRSNYYVKYRVIAINGVGNGIPSPDLLVLTDTYPR